MSKYQWEPIGDEGYKRLIRPDSTRVTALTEPEDRTSYRDLAPITCELNDLMERAERAERELAAARRVVEAAAVVERAEDWACAIAVSEEDDEDDIAIFNAHMQRWGELREAIAAYRAATQEQQP